MALAIHAIGDAEILASALNGIAALAATGSYAKFIAIGLILGILLAPIRLLMAASQPGAGGSGLLSPAFGPWMLGGMILLAAAGVSAKFTVVVNDVYTAEARTVDNVPAIVAIPAFITTSVGKGITADIETMVQPVDSGQLLGHGYATAYQNLARLSRHLTLPVGETDLWKSLSNYVVDCVKLDMESIDPPGTITEQALLSGDSPWAVMGAANFANIDTVTYLDPARPGGQQQSCGQAYESIDAALQAMLSAMGAASDTSAYLKAQLGIHDDSRSFDELLATQMAALGLVADTTGTFMQKLLLRRVYNEAAGRYTAAKGDVAWTVMLTQAETRKSGEAEASGSFFLKYARPLMALVEMLLILMGIFVPFLLASGAYRVVAGWAMGWAWLSMWPPLMAMCNAYIHLKGGQALADLIAGTGGAVSLLTLERMEPLLGEWAAMAAALAGGIPVMSAALLSGGIAGGMRLRPGSGATESGGAGVGAGEGRPAVAAEGTTSSRRTWGLADGQGTTVERALAATPGRVGAAGTMVGTRFHPVGDPAKAPVTAIAEQDPGPPHGGLPAGRIEGLDQPSSADGWVPHELHRRRGLLFHRDSGLRYGAGVSEAAAPPAAVSARDDASPGTGVSGEAAVSDGRAFVDRVRSTYGPPRETATPEPRAAAIVDEIVGRTSSDAQSSYGAGDRLASNGPAISWMTQSGRSSGQRRPVALPVAPNSPARSTPSPEAPKPGIPKDAPAGPGSPRGGQKRRRKGGRSQPPPERLAMWAAINSTFGTAVNFAAVSEFEGGQLLHGYVPRDKLGEVQGNSGVTIATGFDVGQHSPAQIRAFGFPRDLERRLLPYAGLKREKALAADPAKLLISKEEADLIDEKVKRRHLSAAIKSWDERTGGTRFTTLTPAQQTVIFSRTFHQGEGLPKTDVARPFYTHATAGRWIEAETELRNYRVQKDWYRRRVAKEADLLKRERESVSAPGSVPGRR